MHSDDDRKAPQVTCILAIYNGQAYVREAIDSVLAQTCPVHELIVVDDGSTDGTWELLGSYGDKLRRVRQANAGPAAARNHGLSIARGELIAFQDADDIWFPDKIERQVARFAARPELALSSTHLQNFWTRELQDEAERFRDHLVARPFPGYGTPPSLLVRRSLFETVGVFNPVLRVGSDTDWFIRAIEHRVVMEVLPEVLVHRGLHVANISRGPRPTMAQILRDSLDRRRSDRREKARPIVAPFKALAEPRVE